MPYPGRKREGLDHIFWDAWVVGGVADALDEQLLHRHKLPVKYMLWESSPSKMQHVVFSLDGTICLLGDFSRNGLDLSTAFVSCNF